MDRLAAHLSADDRVVYSRRDVDRLFPRLRGGQKLRSVLSSGPAGWAVASRAFALTPPRSRFTYRMRRALQVPRFFVPLQHIYKFDPGATVVLDDWMVNVFAGAVLAGSLRHSEALSMITYFNSLFDAYFVFFEVEPRSAVERLCSRAHERRSGRFGVEATIFDSMDTDKMTSIVNAKVDALNALKIDMVHNLMAVCSIDAGGSRDNVHRSLCSALRLPINSSILDADLWNTVGTHKSQSTPDLRN